MSWEETFISWAKPPGETEQTKCDNAATQISRDEESGTLYLNYNYSNRPKATIRDRSAIHDGAARLRIVESPERSLEGEYWTGRCTVGDMSFRFRSKELLDAFSGRRTDK